MTNLTRRGEVFTRMALDVFRLNGLLLTAGDRLVDKLGLTSARWQIIGAIVAADHAQPVAWLARTLGANRQNVQRIVNDLRAAGLVTLEPNPHHRRAPIVVLSDKGRQAFNEAMRLQAPWANDLADGLPLKDLATTHRIVSALRHRLEHD